MPVLTKRATRLIATVFLNFAFACPINAAPEPTDRQLAGTYHLAGITEVGSGRVLEEDGKFDWYLIYGGLDQRAQGSWQRKDDRVLLKTELPEPGSPIFTPPDRRDWDRGDETALLQDEYYTQVERVNERCRFISGLHAVDAMEDAAPRDETMGADAALVWLRSAIDSLEKAAQSAMTMREAARNGTGRQEAAEDSMRAAEAAMSLYREAESNARQVYWDANLEVAALPEPVYPAECRLPKFPDEPADLRGGYSVIVSDPDAGMTFSGIDATFVFDDGRQVTATTTRSGRAAVRLHVGNPLRAIIMKVRGEPPSISFDVGLSQSSSFLFRVDSRRLMRPPFETFELRVDGTALIPVWDGREEQGRYVRN